MHKFGQMAMFIVAILIVCGGILLVMLLGSVGELFTSDYGQFLLLELLLVACMLMLGAWHKFSLVPDLKRNSKPHKLSQSIAVEGLLSICVLNITSIFTTLVGPAMH
jgi:putative copper resistance protein D